MCPGKFNEANVSDEEYEENIIAPKASLATVSLSKKRARSVKNITNVGVVVPENSEEMETVADSPQWSLSLYKFDKTASTPFQRSCIIVVANANETTMSQKEKALDFLSVQCTDLNVQNMIAIGVVAKVVNVLNQRQSPVNNVEQSLFHKYLKLFANLTVGEIYFNEVMRELDLPSLVDLLKLPETAGNIIWQCLWTLNNIVMDVVVYRRQVLESGILGALVKLLKGKKIDNKRVLIELTRLLSNLAVKRGLDADDRYNEIVIELIALVSKLMNPTKTVPTDVRIYVCEFLAGVSFRDKGTAAERGPVFAAILETDSLVGHLIELARTAASVAAADQLLAISICLKTNSFADFKSR